MSADIQFEGFLHLTSIEWDALHHLAEAAGEALVTTLLRSGSTEAHRLAAQQFMERELADAKQRASTPSHSMKNEVVKLETSTYSGVGNDRLPLNRWYREVELAISSRRIEMEPSKVNFLISRLTGKAKEWALGKLVTEPDAFDTLKSLQDDLRLAFEPPQDESRMRAAFFALKQGKMSMRDYVQKTRHWASCVVTHPIDMASQVHVFVYGMREGMTRYCLTRDEPQTLEAAFALALREDYTVTASYARAASAEERANGGPEPMEIDAIEYGSAGSSRSSDARAGRGGRGGQGGRGPRLIICFRCQKPGNRAAVCRAPAPVVTVVEASAAADATSPALPKKRAGPVGAGRPTGWNGGPGPPAAARPPSPTVLHTQFNATTSRGDTRLIVVRLHVAGARRPLRALLDSGATNNFVRASCLSDLPAGIRVREGPGEMSVKLADGKPRLLPRKSVMLSYEFDGFTSLDEFLVIDMRLSFDCILGMPWLTRYQPDIDWLSRSVKRRRGYDVSATFAQLLAVPEKWPHVAVVDPQSTTKTTPRVSDGTQCVVCASATCDDHVVQQRLSQGANANLAPRREGKKHVRAVEQGLPQSANADLAPRRKREKYEGMVEQRLPPPTIATRATSYQHSSNSSSESVFSPEQWLAAIAEESTTAKTQRRRRPRKW